MLFILALPVVCCVALLWRYLQIYAPSNILIRTVRSGPPRWRTAGALVVLTTALLIAMHAVSLAVEHGAPVWLNLVVLVLACDAIKVGWLAAGVTFRSTVRCAR